MNSRRKKTVHDPCPAKGPFVELENMDGEEDQHIWLIVCTGMFMFHTTRDTKTDE
jgi:hypothetical protein